MIHSFRVSELFIELNEKINETCKKNNYHHELPICLPCTTGLSKATMEASYWMKGSFKQVPGQVFNQWPVN